MQLASKNVISTKISLPLNSKVCVETESVEFLVAPNPFHEVTTYKELSDAHLSVDLEESYVALKEYITSDVFSDHVPKASPINNTDSDDQLRIGNLFILCHILIGCYALSLMLMDTQDVSVHHLLPAIRTELLKSRLSPDLKCFYYNLCKNFEAFTKKQYQIVRLIPSGWKCHMQYFF